MRRTVYAFIAISGACACSINSSNANRRADIVPGRHDALSLAEGDTPVPSSSLVEIFAQQVEWEMPFDTGSGPALSYSGRQKDKKLKPLLRVAGDAKLAVFAEPIALTTKELGLIRSDVWRAATPTLDKAVPVSAENEFDLFRFGRSTNLMACAKLVLTSKIVGRAALVCCRKRDDTMVLAKAKALDRGTIEHQIYYELCPEAATPATPAGPEPSLEGEVPTTGEKMPTMGTEGAL